MGRKARGGARPQESGRMLPPPLLLSPVSHLQTPAWHNLTPLHTTSLGISNKIEFSGIIEFASNSPGTCGEVEKSLV